MFSFQSNVPQNDSEFNILYRALALVFLVCWLVHNMFFENSIDHLITLSVGLSFLGFALMALKINKQTSNGISLNMLIFYALAMALRLSNDLWLTSYIPEPTTGDYTLYRILEICILCLCLWLIHTVKQHQDTPESKMPFLVIPMFLFLSYFTASDNNDKPFFDMLYMAAQYIDVIAIVPQIWLVSKAEMVERSISHCMGLIILARFIFSAFWIIFDTLHISMVSQFRYAMLFIAFMHIIFCSDYIYYWAKTIRAPEMVLPDSIMV